MPTPVYALRLSKKTQDDIAELARIYGAPNGRVFAREILEVMTSGNTDKIKAFNARLIKGMGEQLTLKLNAAMDGATEARNPSQEVKKKVKRVKGASRRAKRV